MNQREREVGKRLRIFRERIRWSQNEFARAIGLSRDQLAHVEYHRTPLRYDIAWRIRAAFGVSLSWLWGSSDGAPNDLSEDTGLPLPSSTGLHKNALLTEVFEAVHGKIELPPMTEGATHVPQISEDDLRHRALHVALIKTQVRYWIARLPDGYVADFHDKLLELEHSYLEALPKESEEIIGARLDALLFEEMRSEIQRRITQPASLQKNDLTDAETPPKTFDIENFNARFEQVWKVLKPTLEGKNPRRLELARPVALKLKLERQLPSLLDRLKKATAEPGKKTALADFLTQAMKTKTTVPLASVSRWLSGEREPGGEVALQMLRWVELQEHSAK